MTVPRSGRPEVRIVSEDSMNLTTRLILSHLVILTVAAVQAIAAESPASKQPSPPIRIFVDCANCGEVFDNETLAIDDYFRQELSALDYVRDRRQADVHVLISWQKTGAGGTEFMMEFIGQGRFAQMRDTLLHVANESDTDDMIRAGLLRNLKIGLVRYVARTAQSDQLSVGYMAPVSESAVDQPRDPWDFWVFNIGLSTQLNGEKHYRDLQLVGELSASRVTEAWQFYLGGWNQYFEQKFEWMDESGIWNSTFSKKRAWNFTTYAVKSLSNHWSIALTWETNSSTFGNLDLSSVVNPGLEYNLFPYSESSRRMLRIEYYLALEYADYIERTIYFETEEWLVSERLSATADIIQPWGTITSQVSGRHYLHDLENYRVWWTSQLSLRVIEGLSLTLSSQVQWIHDQLSLPLAGATEQQALLRQRELETSYLYGLQVGVNYSFGSIYNNVVNRRFGG